MNIQDFLIYCYHYIFQRKSKLDLFDTSSESVDNPFISEDDGSSYVPCSDSEQSFSIEREASQPYLVRLMF